jgi:hypothetical protein
MIISTRTIGSHGAAADLAEVGAKSAARAPSSATSTGRAGEIRPSGHLEKPSETTVFSAIAASDNQHYRSLKAYPEAYPGLEAPADAVMMIVPVAEPAAALTMAA